MKLILYEKCTATKGDLLVCEGGDIGRAAIWPYDTDIRIQNHIHRLRSYSEICTEYYYYIFFLYKHAGWIGGKGIGIQGLSANALHALLFPLPPLSEQHRIVTKIKAFEPFFGDWRLLNLLLQDADFQMLLLLFQLLHPLLGGRRQDALFNGGHQVAKLLLHILQFRLQDRQAGILPALIFQQPVRQHIDSLVIHHLFQRCLHHKLLHRFLAHRLQIAGILAVTLAGAALVVIVSHSGVAVAAFPASMAPQLPQNSLVVSR